MATRDLASRAKKQRDYRKATDYEYDKKYKRAHERAMRRLTKKYPNAFRKIFNEERAAEGLDPVREK